MASWGAGSFENDTAMDWLSALTADNAVDPVVEALEAVLEDTGVVNERSGCEALAAAELVASLNPEEATVLPDEVHRWLKRQKLKPTGQLVRLAKAAVKQVGSENSELCKHWQRAVRGGREWACLIDDLAARLDYDAVEASALSSRWWRLW